MKKSKIMKWLLIFQSMSPLFVLLGVRVYSSYRTNKFSKLLLCVCLLWVVIAIFAYLFLISKKRINPQCTYTITEVEEFSADKSLEFTLALIIPLLIEVPKTIYDLIFFVLLISLVVLLLSKSKYWYNNPVLTLIGFRTFSFKFREHDIKDTVYAISKQKLVNSNQIYYSDIYDSKILYAWRKK